MDDNFKDEFLELSEKEKTFCEEYVIDCNAKQAAIRAGYEITQQHASRMAKSEKLAPFIKYLRTIASEMAGVTLIRNAKELAKIAYGNAANLRADWMNVKDWDELTGEEKSILSEVKSQVTTTYTKQGDPITTEILHFKTHDKLKAIEMLNKMFGLNQPEQVELSGKDGAPIVVTGMVIKKE